MSNVHPFPTQSSLPALAAQNLLQIVQAQVDAIAAGDLGAFEAAANQRDALIPTLDREALAYISDNKQLLRQIMDLDRQALLLARKQLEATTAELTQVRQGKVALRGYSRAQGQARRGFRQVVPLRPGSYLSGTRPVA